MVNTSSLWHFIDNEMKLDILYRTHFIRHFILKHRHIIALKSITLRNKTEVINILHWYFCTQKYLCMSPFTWNIFHYSYLKKKGNPLWMAKFTVHFYWDTLLPWSEKLAECFKGLVLIISLLLSLSLLSSLFTNSQWRAVAPPVHQHTHDW